jgi:hypothetical protein
MSRERETVASLCPAALIIAVHDNPLSCPAPPSFWVPTKTLLNSFCRRMSREGEIRALHRAFMLCGA